MAAWYPMPGCNLYNASKSALRWLGIGLQTEITNFNIKHCLVEPGFFRTELLNPAANFVATPKERRLNDYADLNATNDENFKAFHGKQLGDPVKGASIIYDVLTSSGVAVGRDVPPFLPLGSDACAEITKSIKSTIQQVQEWEKIVSVSDFRSG
jgi:NAD(P)-dependent dehydrogenase (short-subunit alcohol dehydrogenase family)